MDWNNIQDEIPNHTESSQVSGNEQMGRNAVEDNLPESEEECQNESKSNTSEDASTNLNSYSNAVFHVTTSIENAMMWNCQETNGIGLGIIGSLDQGELVASADNTPLCEIEQMGRNAVEDNYQESMEECQNQSQSNSIEEVSTDLNATLMEKQMMGENCLYNCQKSNEIGLGIMGSLEQGELYASAVLPSVSGIKQMGTVDSNLQNSVNECQTQSQTNCNSEDVLINPRPFPTATASINNDSNLTIPPHDACGADKVKKDMKPPKPTTSLAQAMTAINALGNRKGSSVIAIVKYLKENGRKPKNERRFRRHMTKTLKKGLSDGHLKQKKMSFKISELAKRQAKAIKKMKANKAKVRLFCENCLCNCEVSDKKRCKIMGLVAQRDLEASAAARVSNSPTSPNGYGANKGAEKNKKPPKPTKSLLQVMKAINTLDNRKGSSVMMIFKYLVEHGPKPKDDARFGRNLKKTLKLGVKNGHLEMVKRSYKIKKNSLKRYLREE